MKMIFMGDVVLSNDTFSNSLFSDEFQKMVEDKSEGYAYMFHERISQNIKDLKEIRFRTNGFFIISR